MRIKRRAVQGLVILVCFILQSTVFQSLSIGSIVPNLLLIVTVSFGFMRGKLSGLDRTFLRTFKRCFLLEIYWAFMP